MNTVGSGEGVERTVGSTGVTERPVMTPEVNQCSESESLRVPSPSLPPSPIYETGGLKDRERSLPRGRPRAHVPEGEEIQDKATLLRRPVSPTRYGADRQERRSGIKGFEDRV